MAWLSGYNYRKAINIGSSAGAGTDYQVKVIVQPGNGTDGTPAGTVYLNGKSAYFPNDLVFTDNDGTTLLKHWFEYDGNNFWVKVADTLESNATIYLYYGNTTALPTPIDAPNSGVWIRPQTTPIFAVGAGGQWDDWWANIHSIVKVGSTYHAFYTGSKNDSLYKIGHATSSDGITWSKDGSNPVLDIGGVGKWDHYAVGSPCVWYEGSTFYMLYAGESAAGGWKIGLATSPDGTTWTRYDVDNPVMTGTATTWDSLFVVPGTMMLKEGSTYYFYYWGGTSATLANTWQIGLATSTDLHTWDKSGNNPVLVKGANNAYDSDVLEPCVFKIGSTYYMWYQADSNAVDESYICLASSAAKDSGWSKSSLNPILNHEQDAWDSAWTESPIVLDFGTHWRLYYSGSNGSAATPRMQSSYTIYTVVGDGPNTFLLFDDFHGLTLNSALWNNTGTFTQNRDGIEKYAANTNAGYFLKSQNTFTAPLALEAKCRVGADWANEYSWIFVLMFDSAWATTGYLGGHYKDASLDVSRVYKFGTGATNNGTTESIAASTYYKYSLLVGSTTQKLLIGGVQKGSISVAIQTNPNNVQLATYRAAATSAYTTYYDWVFVRKYLDTEPSISSFGAEEPLDITLAVDGLAHIDSLGAVALTQVHNLAVNALSHANGIDNVVLSQIHQLAVQALSHAHSIDGLTLTQVHNLVVQAMSHSHALGGVSLSQIHNLIVQNLAHAHGIDNISLLLSFLLVVENLIHGHSLGTVNLSQNSLLIVQALLHAHTILGEIGLIQAKPKVAENFSYKFLKAKIPPALPEGDFAYDHSSLKIPDPGQEGSFAYQRLHLKKVAEES